MREIVVGRVPMDIGINHRVGGSLEAHGCAESIPIGNRDPEGTKRDAECELPPDQPLLNPSKAVYF